MLRIRTALNYCLYHCKFGQVLLHCFDNRNKVSFFGLFFAVDHSAAVNSEHPQNICVSCITWYQIVSQLRSAPKAATDRLRRPRE